MSRRRAVAALGLLLVPVPAGTAVADPGPAGGQGCLRPTTIYTGQVPWPLRRLWPERAWPLSRGAGVLVAVVGSGIDARNPQFAPGQVLPGRDLVDGGTADDDCDGSGTFVAGLVAARPDPRTTVTGLAPGARLLPVRVAQSGRAGPQAAPPARTAAGVDYAAAAGADVIVLYDSPAGPGEELARSVAAATRGGSVVVAGGRSGSATTDEPATCSLPGVLAVAAVAADGAAVPGSCSGPGLDVAAPGADLVSTSAGSAGALGHARVGTDAPGYAAGYAAGALALLLGYEPDLAPATAVARLARTADPPATGQRDDRVGRGVVDPYAAMTELRPAPARAGPPASVRVAGGDRPPADRTPVVVGGGLLAAAVVAVVAAAAARPGRARRWQPGRRTATASRPVRRR